MHYKVAYSVLTLSKEIMSCEITTGFCFVFFSPLVLKNIWYPDSDKDLDFSQLSYITEIFI